MSKGLRYPDVWNALQGTLRVLSGVELIVTRTQREAMLASAIALHELEMKLYETRALQDDIAPPTKKGERDD